MKKIKYTALYSLLLIMVLLLQLHQGHSQVRLSNEPIWPLQPGPSADSNMIYARIQVAKIVLDSRPDSAIDMLNQTLWQSKTIRYTNGATLSLLSLGKAYMLKARYNEALYLWNEGLRTVYLSGGDSKLAASFYTNIGVLYNIEGQYAKSLDVLFRALQLSQNIPGNDQGIATIYSNIAMLYLRMPGTPPSKQTFYLDKAALYARKANDPKLIAGVLANMGTLYVEQKDFVRGRQLFDSALHMAVQNRLTETEYSILLSLGEYYLTNNEPEAALGYLERARGLDQQAVNPYYSTLTDLRIGEAYAQLQRYQEAIRFVEEAEKSSLALGLLSYRPQIYDTYFRLYRKTGDFEKALHYYELYSRLNDSLLKRESLHYMSEMDIKYQTLQKEQEIAAGRQLIREQQDRLSRNRIELLLTAACVVLMAALLFFTLQGSKQRRKILLKEKSIDVLKSRIEGEEKERLRISKELHDGIGGMLAAIKYNVSSFSRELSPEDREKLRGISGMLESTSNEVRTVAHNLVPDVVLHFGLQEALRTYCGSFSGERLHIGLQCYGRLELMDQRTELVLYRIVQELIQNVIKHADADTIDIQLMEYDQHIHLTFEDNGRGFDPEAVTSGLGLENIKRRAEFLQGELSIASMQNKGVSVHLSFPLQHNLK